jgi:3-deoxy-D-manno-octulosonic-acid transferase
MSFVFNLVYFVLLLLLSPWIIWQSWKHGRYRQGWREKLLGLPTAPDTSEPIVWFHAVSVGEVQVLRALIEKVEADRPDLAIAISVSTDSGIELARKLYARHFVFFAPFDFSWAVRRTLTLLKPKLIVLAELELWPNWIRAARQQGVPIAVMNGRLSERSFHGYLRIPSFLRRQLFAIDWVGAQSETYAQRFIELGVPASRVVVTGNTKFDGANGDRMNVEVQVRRKLLALDHESTVLVAGSTQAPEEQLLIDTFCRLVPRYPNLRLLIVPRHAERFEQVAGLIEATGLAWERRSRCSEPVANPHWKIFLGDTIGELRWWWGVADLGFVGGSFGDRGGQNMIEPCAYGVATSFGPNTKNFADIVKLLLEKHACMQFQSQDQVATWIEEMLNNESNRFRLANAAKATCASHRGAVARTWLELQRFL